MRSIYFRKYIFDKNDIFRKLFPQVLTAAHCTHAVPNGENFYVNVGDHDLTLNDDAKNHLIQVAQVIENSAYSTTTQDSDTSLLKLSTPLTFRRDVQPVCLPWKFRNADFSGQTVTASGSF